MKKTAVVVSYLRVWGQFRIQSLLSESVIGLVVFALVGVAAVAAEVITSHLGKFSKARHKKTPGGDVFKSTKSTLKG